MAIKKAETIECLRLDMEPKEGGKAWTCMVFSSKIMHCYNADGSGFSSSRWVITDEGQVLSLLLTNNDTMAQGYKPIIVEIAEAIKNWLANKTIGEATSGESK